MSERQTPVSRGNSCGGSRPLTPRLHGISTASPSTAGIPAPLRIVSPVLQLPVHLLHLRRNFPIRHLLYGAVIRVRHTLTLSAATLRVTQAYRKDTNVDLNEIGNHVESVTYDGHTGTISATLIVTETIAEDSERSRNPGDCSSPEERPTPTPSQQSKRPAGRSPDQRLGRQRGSSPKPYRGRCPGRRSRNRGRNAQVEVVVGFPSRRTSRPSGVRRPT